VKERWQRIAKWQHLVLCLLVLATLILHFVLIMNPPELVLDEYHYVNDARGILASQDTARPEHPPLGKLFVVAGMRIFGDNPMGWRFFAVIFGTACVVLFYFICRALNMPQNAVLFATFLFTLENMTFVQSSVAMLDIYSQVFTLGAFLLYLKGGYLLSGISTGLSALAKLGGALTYPAIFIHWIFSKERKSWQFLGLTLLAPISFALFLPAFQFALDGQALNPVEQIKNMLSLSGSLTFASTTHPAASRPWEWILRPEAMYYWYDPHYISMVSITVWGLIIPSVIYMIFRAKKGNNAALFGLSWFAGLYLVWIPMSLITNRISYPYYFYPVVGAIIIGIALAMSQILEIEKAKGEKRRRAATGGVVTYLVVHAAFFVIVSPVFSRLVHTPFIMPPT
jgi:predicted membrane-bound dolichyl-phosphate-mannose-protein mannosyltransferase